jgi:hypothetical protein
MDKRLTAPSAATRSRAGDGAVQDPVTKHSSVFSTPTTKAITRAHKSRPRSLRAGPRDRIHARGIAGRIYN